MPALKHRLPSYRLHKPSDQAIVTLEGRDHYLGRYGTSESRAEYDRLVAEWLGSARLPIRTDESAVVANRRRGQFLINELIVAYNQFAMGYYTKNGLATGELQAIKYSLKPLAELYGPISVVDFGPRAFKAVREKMIDAGLARTLINARMKRIRRMFKWGVENQLVESGILLALQAVAALKRGRCGVRETDPVRPVPDAFVEAVLPLVLPQVRAMIELQRLTGMRPCEVTIMRGCDLDTTGKIWLYRPSSHKTEHHGVERSIYLGPKAQEVVNPFLKPDLQAFLFSPRDAMEQFNRKRRANRKSPMTPSQAKRRPKQRPRKTPADRYITSSYAHSIAHACKKAGVPTWGPNRLRHNAATFFRKEFGLDAARALLGHRSPAVTEVYAELDRGKAMEVMAKVGGSWTAGGDGAEGGL